MNPTQREEHILKNLEEIRRGLYGDATNLHSGLIARFEAVEAYIEQDKKLKAKIGGVIWVVGAMWTAITAFITYLVDKLS